VCECVVAVVAGVWFTHSSRRAIGEDGRYAWGVVVVVVFFLCGCLSRPFATYLFRVLSTLSRQYGDLH
jgi:hypothetical protein